MPSVSLRVVQVQRPSRGVSRRARACSPRVLAALVLLIAAVALPAAAPAGQSSQATAVPFLQVATGVHHSCATIGGAGAPAPVRCWGFNGNGQVGYPGAELVGDDETPGAAGPVDLGPGRTARALAAGEFHTCAALDDGTVRCWGFEFDGQLGYRTRDHIGDNETPGSVGPVDLGAGRTATQVTAGARHTCAVLDDGAVRCWGLGSSGQLGYANVLPVGFSETPGQAGPVDLGAGRSARAVSAGGAHTCALLDDFSVRCWGLGNAGQLGYGNTSAVGDNEHPREFGPVALGAGRSARAITTGDAHTCAVLDDGSVRCWGLGSAGQLGYGNANAIGDDEAPAAAGPVDLGSGRTAVAISAGAAHTCAVLDNGAVRCWGSGASGRLGYADGATIGDDETAGSAGPVDIGGGRAVAISAGAEHTCARLDDGGVRCWGNGGQGRLGLCAVATIGDDETPGSVGRVDLGAGGAACPATAAAPPRAPGQPSLSPPARATSDASALAAERRRARSLRACRSEARSAERRARTRALRRHRAGSRARALALRSVSRRAARGRARCLTRFGRTPGRVAGFAARAVARGKIVLSFRATGSDGSKEPAARSYLVKQSLRPMRTARDFRRAGALCAGACSFDDVAVGATLTLDVTRLRPRTRYYYRIAARDNVSKRTGPLSRTASAKTP